MKRITFQNKHKRTISIGNNGTIKTSGVAVCEDKDTLIISPINSFGNIAHCQIGIPKQDISEVCFSLMESLTQNERAELARRLYDTVENKISLVWSVEDVLSVWGSLSEEQAKQVLDRVKQCHDANLGVNWEVISITAQEMLPQETDTEYKLERAKQEAFKVIRSQKGVVLVDEPFGPEFIYAYRGVYGEFIQYHNHIELFVYDEPREHQKATSSQPDSDLTVLNENSVTAEEALEHLKKGGTVMIKPYTKIHSNFVSITMQSFGSSLSDEEIVEYLEEKDALEIWPNV